MQPGAADKRPSGHDELDARGGVDDHEAFGIAIALQKKRLALGGVDMRPLPRVYDSLKARC